MCAYVACTYVCASQNKNLAVRAPVDMTKGSPAACGSLLKVRTGTELPLRPLVKTKVQVFFLIPSPCASKNRSSTSRHVNQETRSNRHENVMRSYFVLDLNRLWYFLRVRTLVQAILSFYRTMVFECKSRRRRRTNPHQNTLRMYRWEWKTLPKR